MPAPISDQDRDLLQGKRVVASVSGGKDSAAVSLWLTENGIEHDRVFADTNWEARETYTYLRGALTSAIGTIAEVRSSIVKDCPCSSEAVAKDEDGLCLLCAGTKTTWGMIALILYKGMFPSRVRRFCTQELKVFPLADYVHARQDEFGEVVNVVGIRAEESKARAKFDPWEWQETFDCLVWRPALAWTFDDVVQVHRDHRLKPNPLYLSGASRVGCWPCIYARKDEIRAWSDRDPKRVAIIRELERLSARACTERVARDQRTPDGLVPGFFGLWRPEKSTRECASIDEVIQWSKTAKGGKNLAMFQPGPDDEGCMRWGMCEAASPESTTTTTCEEK